jgi:signal transduction histidine kinase
VSTEHLRFAPEILRRLGEELVPHPDLGVVELVRNAYDADADICRIELHDVEQPGGRVVVADDGDGMSVEEIRDGWLLLGRSDKTHGKYSRKNRRQVGEKGLGRLAALRLGRKVTLRTRPYSRPGVEHVLTIHWGAFDDAETVEDVPLDIVSEATSESHGTDVEILDLRVAFAKPDVRRLARSLLLLTGPFPSAQTFSPTLQAPEFGELEQVVRNVYFDEAEYIITAHLDERGQAQAELHDWHGTLVSSANHQTISSAGRSARNRLPTLAYFAPASEFKLWAFSLSAEAFLLRNSRRKISSVREWLKAVGGVHLYHRGLRVHPYGDDGHDWLDMNLRRARSPELRPSTNTSVGRVSVDDDDQMLIPKTDRTGFLENNAFLELRRLGQDVLDWAATERTRQRDEHRRQAKQKARDRMATASIRVEHAVQSLPPQVRPVVEHAVKDLRDAVEERVQTVEDDLQLYRSLGTVGTTTAVFAHETMRPVATIEEMTRTIERRARKELGERYTEQFSDPIGLAFDAASSLRTFAELPLRLLQRRKRRPQVVDINAVVADLLTLFEPHLKAAEITVDTQFTDAGAAVRTTVAAIEAIVANLLANATYMFTQHRTSATVPRTILIRTTSTSQAVILSVLDNGSGIDTERIALEDIWLPGKTTREEGTGLGLTIVRDITRDMGGAVHAKAHGELGGAEFDIELPPATAQP